ncbi:MAG: GIY-YIG nuclease family protein [Cyclobacteriaceae bacterium]
MNTIYEKRSGYFYILEFQDAFKFGITTRLNERIKEHRKENPKSPFSMIKNRYFGVFEQARLIEKLLVKMLPTYKVANKQEWIRKPFPLSDIWESYSTVEKIVLRAYQVCNHDEWRRLVYDKISDVNLNRIIASAKLQDDELNRETRQGSFLAEDEKPRSSFLGYSVLNYLTDEEAYEEFSWIRKSCTGPQYVPY